MTPFANGTAANATPVHGFELPPEGREYRPTYSGGRYVLPDPTTGDTARFTRVTTGAHVLDDTSGLDNWKMGNVVLGLKDRPDLLDSLDLFAEPADVRKQVRSIATRASEVAGANEASELGTAIHAWTEAVERDGLAVDQVPTRFRPYVAAYVDILDQHGITTLPGMVERIVYNADTGWVGTLDRIYRLADGTRVIGDVKTSKTLQYGYLGFAVQLATYANATHMLNLEGTAWEPMPAVGNAYGVIAHIPSNRPGQANLVTLDLEAGAYALELALAVKNMRSTAASVIPNKWPLPKPVDLFALIQGATSADQLAALFDSHATMWTEEHTQAGYKRLSDLGLM